MTPLERVREARATLLIITVARSVLWGGAAGLALYALAGSLTGRSDFVRVVSVGVALSIAAALIWYDRAVWSLEHVALWIESRMPELRYALVTAIDPRAAHVSGELAHIVGSADTRPVVRRAGARALIHAGAAAGAGVLLLAFIPAGRPAGVASRGRGVVTTSNVLDRVADVNVRVTPPRYTRQPPRETRNPAVISALVGSVIDLSGRGAAAGLRATVGDDSVGVSPPDSIQSSGWAVRLTMPAQASVVRIRDRDHDRVIALDAVQDGPPSVVLSQPAHDSTIRMPRGILHLDASATDDIGLRDGYYELIVSAGNEEGSYRSVEHRVGAVRFGDAREAPLSAVIDLGAIGLTPGGRLSVRAVVRDDNTLSGPGIGTSETRTFRVAAPGEYDSLAVEAGAPPPIDSSQVTQRMIVERTRALQHSQPRLPKDTVTQRSDALGQQEDVLAARVQSLLNGPDEEEGGGPLVLPDWQRPLFDTALRALGDAAAELHNGRVASALSPELLALRVLDSARAGNRLYLRGGVPTLVVNTARVRLSGQDKPDAGPRTPEPATDTAASAAIARLGTVARIARTAPDAAADSAMVLRIAVASEWPRAAAALSAAASDLRARRDAAPSLTRARRAIAGAPSVVPAMSPWAGGGQ